MEINIGDRVIKSNEELLQFEKYIYNYLINKKLQLNSNQTLQYVTGLLSLFRKYYNSFNILQIFYHWTQSKYEIIRYIILNIYSKYYQTVEKIKILEEYIIQGLNDPSFFIRASVLDNLLRCIEIGSNSFTTKFIKETIQAIYLLDKSSKHYKAMKRKLNLVFYHSNQFSLLQFTDLLQLKECILKTNSSTMAYRFLFSLTKITNCTENESILLVQCIESFKPIIFSYSIKSNHYFNNIISKLKIKVNGNQYQFFDLAFLEYFNKTTYISSLFEEIFISNTSIYSHETVKLYQDLFFRHFKKFIFSTSVGSCEWYFTYIDCFSISQQKSIILEIFKRCKSQIRNIERVINFYCKNSRNIPIENFITLQPIIKNFSKKPEYIGDLLSSIFPITETIPIVKEMYDDLQETSLVQIFNHFLPCDNEDVYQMVSKFINELQLPIVLLQSPDQFKSIYIKFYILVQNCTKISQQSSFIVKEKIFKYLFAKTGSNKCPILLYESVMKLQTYLDDNDYHSISQFTITNFPIFLDHLATHDTLIPYLNIISNSKSPIYDQILQKTDGIIKYHKINVLSFINIISTLKWLENQFNNNHKGIQEMVQDLCKRLKSSYFYPIQFIFHNGFQTGFQKNYTFVHEKVGNHDFMLDIIKNTTYPWEIAEFSLKCFLMVDKNSGTNPILMNYWKLYFLHTKESNVLFNKNEFLVQNTLSFKNEFKNNFFNKLVLSNDLGIMNTVQKYFGNELFNDSDFFKQYYQISTNNQIEFILPKMYSLSTCIPKFYYYGLIETCFKINAPDIRQTILNLSLVSKSFFNLTKSILKKTNIPINFHPNKLVLTYKFSLLESIPRSINILKQVSPSEFSRFTYENVESLTYHLTYHIKIPKRMKIKNLKLVNSNFYYLFHFLDEDNIGTLVSLETLEIEVISTDSFYFKAILKKILQLNNLKKLVVLLPYVVDVPNFQRKQMIERNICFEIIGERFPDISLPTDNIFFDATSRILFFKCSLTHGQNYYSKLAEFLENHNSLLEFELTISYTLEVETFSLLIDSISKNRFLKNVSIIFSQSNQNNDKMAELLPKLENNNSIEFLRLETDYGKPPFSNPINFITFQTCNSIFNQYFRILIPNNSLGYPN